MTEQPAPEQSLKIQRPCPKTWEELEGGERRRYCSECALHVHDAALLTHAEAVRMVRESTERVCMRIERDASGRAIFRDTPALGRVARWTLSAAAGLLAACNGAPADVPEGAGAAAPSAQGAGDPELGQVPTATLGKPMVELGDVALPQEPPLPEPTRLLGEVGIDPGPPGGEPPIGGEPPSGGE
jgi:hypothetical protein